MTFNTIQIMGLLMTAAHYTTEASVTGLLTRSRRGRFLPRLTQPANPEWTDTDYKIILKHETESTTTTPSSQLREVADSFASVHLVEEPGQDEKDIPMDELIEALNKFHSVLKEAAPMAVSKDFSNNLQKIESSYNDYKRTHRGEPAATLSSLLRHEQETGIHQRQQDDTDDDVRLNEKSGAMGLLWIRRSLAFQADMYDEVANGKDTKQAATMAYERQLQSYHGWALRKLFHASGVRRMPEREALLQKIGGYKSSMAPAAELQTVSDLKNVVSLWKPLLHNWRAKFEALGMEDMRRI